MHHRELFRGVCGGAGVFFSGVNGVRGGRGQAWEHWGSVGFGTEVPSIRHAGEILVCVGASSEGCGNVHTVIPVLGVTTVVWHQIRRVSTIVRGVSKVACGVLRGGKKVWMSGCAVQK